MGTWGSVRLARSLVIGLIRIGILSRSSGFVCAIAAAVTVILCPRRCNLRIFGLGSRRFILGGCLCRILGFRYGVSLSRAVWRSCIWEHGTELPLWLAFILGTLSWMTFWIINCLIVFPSLRRNLNWIDHLWFLWWFFSSIVWADLEPCSLIYSAVQKHDYLVLCQLINRGDNSLAHRLWVQG